MHRVLAAVILSAGVSSTAAAEDCASSSATQADLNQCYGDAFRKADAELNGVYRLISHRLEESPDVAKKLVAAQRAWISFRDAECAFTASGTEGGSAQSMVEGQCLEAQTRKRVADLKSYLNCEEGDMSCPVPKPQ